MKHDICVAMIQLNEYTVVARGENNPIGYAEIEVLRFTLGERAVSDVEVIRVEETTNADVLEALRLKFGKDTINEAFPGTRPRLPLEAPGDVPRRTAAREDKTPTHLERPKSAKGQFQKKAAEPVEPEATVTDIFDSEDEDEDTPAQ